MAITTDMIRRIERLEAVHSIQQLVARYALGADRRNSPQIMTTLFSPDAVWEAPGFGRCEGRKAIVKHLADIGRKQIVWSLHYMVAPIIELADDLKSGTCRWHLWELAQMADKNASPRSHWIGGWYESEVIQVRKRWIFSHVLLDLRLVHQHHEQWTPLPELAARSQ